MTEERKEKAITLFAGGVNCAQSVLMAYAQDFNMDEDTAFRVACGFGGGMARKQFTCGAVTGAIMVLGMKYANKNTEGYEKAKLNTYIPVRDFFNEFLKRNNALDCRGLLGLDLNDEEQHKLFKERNLNITVCRKCVRDSIDILDEMFSTDPVES